MKIKTVKNEVEVFGENNPVSDIQPLHGPTPYVFFVSPKSASYPEVIQQIPQILDGDAVLVRDGAYTKLNPFKFFIISAFQHFSVMDSQGRIEATTLDVNVARNDRTKKWSDHVEVLMIALLPDGSLCPATCTFKTTKANAAHRAIEELRLADDAQTWAARSPAHKASAAAPWPYARFIVTVMLKKGVSRGGFSYIAASSVAHPTGVPEWTALGEALKDARFKASCEAVYERFKDRVADIKMGV